MSKRKNLRGSIWSLWDLHIHTPASFHWDGEKFNGDKKHDDALIDEMIHALNNAEPEVFTIMDYWTFDGWFKLQNRLKEPESPKLEKTVFPGIELRLVAPMNGRLNAHVIFSNEIEKQILDDFKSALQIAIIDRPLSDSALIHLARQTGEDKLSKHGFQKNDTDNEEDKAIKAGSTIAEITMESYKQAISKVPNNQAIGFMPFDTNDGLDDIKWADHYAYTMTLFQSFPIFETRDFDKRCAFVGEKTDKNSKYFNNFQGALKNIPRLAVSGSDAHCFVGEAGNDDKRGYGDFPSNKKTWIKAEPTFKGLQQAILEPAKRSYVGEKPPKINEIELNKTFYIDSVEIKKTGTKSVGQWLDGCNIPLNPDLTAIIGNKGSGKSALADVIAMLGNSKQSKHFSFLKKDRFFGKSGEPANQFTGILTWHDGGKETRILSELSPEEKTERVRYIPQGYFEELCNEHTSGESNAFERELRSVIFSHTSEDMRLDALDFEQLIEKQEQSLRNRLSEYRKDLAKINEEIVGIEAQLQPIELKKLTETLQLKNAQIEEHKKLKPDEVIQPKIALDTIQQKIADDLAEVNRQIQNRQERLKTIATSANTELAKQKQAIFDIQERLSLLQRSFDQLKQESADDLILLELSWNDIAVLDIRTSVLVSKKEMISSKQLELKTESERVEGEINELTGKQKTYTAQLDAPQRQYEAYQRQLTEWTQKLDALTGSTTEPETKIGLETRIKQIEQLPLELQKLREKRLQLSRDIFDTLNAQREERERLFKPVQDLIQDNSLIRDDYKLQFQATLSASSDAIANQLFGLIKQTSGEFRGQDEALTVIRTLFDAYDLNHKEGVTGFISNLFEKIETASKGNNEKAVGISNILKKDQTANAVYDLIFGLEFLEPRYSLVFQDTQIEQLSPGQRGALLLIFYLLVDKGQLPIILDQPEENLDNETVFRLLVPVLSEAKKKRQIIMVTHNPNLAVVCDAEQIIYANFSRSDNFTISYQAGAIENDEINKRVVTVLEGTKPAFDNRSGKYF